MLVVDERQVADYEVELVPGVGHFIADERPELVLECAREFLLHQGGPSVELLSVRLRKSTLGGIR